MKKRLLVVLVLLIFIVGSVEVLGVAATKKSTSPAKTEPKKVEPPKPTGPGMPPGMTGGPAQKVGGEAQNGFIIMEGVGKVPAIMLPYFFKSYDGAKKIQEVRGMSEGCKADFSKCTQEDYMKLTKEDYLTGLKYDPKTRTLETSYVDKLTRSIGNIEEYGEGGRTYKMIISDNGRYLVSENSKIQRFDSNSNTFKDIGTLPTGKRLEDITKIEENVVYFKDNTVIIRGAEPIPQSLFDKYKSVIDFEKVTTRDNIPLKEGGSLITFTDGVSGAIVTSVTLKTTMDGKPLEKTETTITLPNGKTVTSNEKISSLDGLKDKNVYYDGKEAKYLGDSVYELTEDKKKVKVEYYKEEGSVKTTLTDKDGGKTVEIVAKNKEVAKFEFNKESILTSGVRYDKEGNKIAEAEIKGGEIEYIEHYDSKTKILTAVSFLEKGDLEGKETRMGLIDSDTVFIDSDNNGKYDATELKYTAEEIKRYFDGKKKDGFKPELLYTQLKTTLERRATDDFFSFDSERSKFWRTMEMTEEIMGWLRPGWHGLSNLFAPGLTNDMRRAADEAFAHVMVIDRASDGLAKACAEKRKVPGESSVFIKTRAGTYQFVGSIQAEKTKEKAPILCSYEHNECPLNYVCKEGLCYENEEATEPAKGYFYKITWGVTAPQDESQTPYVDENRVAIKFNLKFTGANWWLYNSEEGIGSTNTIELKNGGNDGGRIAHYSAKDFKEICILFGAPSKDWLGDEVKSICTEIIDSSKGKIEFETSKEASPSTTTGGGVRLNSNW